MAQKAQSQTGPDRTPRHRTHQQHATRGRKRRMTSPRDSVGPWVTALPSAGPTTRRPSQFRPGILPCGIGCPGGVITGTKDGDSMLLADNSVASGSLVMIEAARDWKESQEFPTMAVTYDMTAPQPLRHKMAIADEETRDWLDSQEFPTTPITFETHRLTAPPFTENATRPTKTSIQPFLFPPGGRPRSDSVSQVSVLAEISSRQPQVVECI